MEGLYSKNKNIEGGESPKRNILTSVKVQFL